MANAHCCDGYNELVIKNKEESATAKFLMVGGYIVVMAVLAAVMYYGVSMGYYPDDMANFF